MGEFWLGHRERLRGRAERDGIESLRPHEIIELLLYYARPRQDMNIVARSLIDTFGSVTGVFNATREQLADVQGVSAGMADWILLTAETVHAYTAIDPDTQFHIECRRDVIDYLVPRWHDVHPPESWLLYTDFDNRLLMQSVLCDSLSWFEPEYVRQSMKEALALQARHGFLVLFMGVQPLMLEADGLEHLLHYARTMRGINVEILDCILVGESGFVSLNSEGFMEKIRHESHELALHERYVAPENNEPENISQ